MKKSSIKIQRCKARSFFWMLLCGISFFAVSQAFGAPPTKVWDKHFSDDLRTDISIGPNGTIYSAGRGANFAYKLHALSSNGSVNWTFDTDWEVTGIPVIGQDNTIYMTGYMNVSGTKEGRLFAITPQGQKKSQFPIAALGENTSSPVLGSDGTVYFASSKTAVSAQPAGKVYAINPDGTQQWAYTFTTHPGHTDYNILPAIGPDGTIYIIFRPSTTSGCLYAFNPNGILKWVSSAHNFSTSPVVHNAGYILIGSSTEGLIAINSDGTNRWTLPSVLSPRNGSLVLDGQKTYVGSSDGKVYALWGYSSVAWSYAFNTSITGLSFSQSGRIYVSTSNRYLHALNNTGTLRWSYRPPESSSNDLSAPVISMGNVYFTSFGQNSSSVHAIKIDSNDTLSDVSPWPTAGQNYRRTGNIRGFFPRPISPVDNSVVQSLPAQFNWQNPSRYDEYRFEIADNPAFSPALPSQTTTSNTIQVTTGLTSGYQYFWRVARLQTGNFPSYSDTRSFIFGSSLQQAILNTPDYGETVNNPVLLAYEFPDAFQYRILVGTNSTLTNIEKDEIQTSTSVQYSLTPNTTYYWAVEPQDANGQSIGSRSPVFMFKTTTP